MTIRRFRLAIAERNKTTPDGMKRDQKVNMFDIPITRAHRSRAVRGAEGGIANLSQRCPKSTETVMDIYERT